MSPLSHTAPAYVPTKRGAPWIPPPPASGLATYTWMPTSLPPPPQFVPWPHLAPPPPPPLPCWSVPQPVPCATGMMVQGPASCGVNAGGTANEAAANQPSPRSVLAVTSPPISPTTSLPTSFPYQMVPPAPPATAGHGSATTAPPPAKRSLASRPPHGRRSRRLRRARPASGAQVRRTRSAPKPRRLFDPASDRTSFMIRNIPNDFTRARLMNILDQHCSIENEKIAPGGVRSQYDFLYLVVDFRTHANKGYAFVNMTSPEAARRLWAHLHGHRWIFKGSAKTCAVHYADLQGHDNLVKHFSGSRFDCHTDEYLPVRFEPPRDGTRPAEGTMYVVGRRLAHSRPSDEN